VFQKKVINVGNYSISAGESRGRAYTAGKKEAIQKQPTFLCIQQYAEEQNSTSVLV